MRILIVEDEIRLAEALGQIMEENKYTADIVHDGEAGLDYALSGIYDVIVLDVMLPKRNGFDIVRELRAQKDQTPVLLLTAKDEVQDKVTGLDCGADDYLTKPFFTEELLARVRALSRRQGDVVLNELSFGDLTLNLSAYTLQCGAKSVRLGRKEFEVIRLLLSNPKIILSKETLLLKSGAANLRRRIITWRPIFPFCAKSLPFCTARCRSPPRASSATIWRKTPMLNKLRWKFVLINMILVTLVLTIVFTAVLASSYHRLEMDGVQAMERVLREGDTAFPKREIGGKLPGGKAPPK